MQESVLSQSVRRLLELIEAPSAFVLGSFLVLPLGARFLNIPVKGGGLGFAPKKLLGAAGVDFVMGCFP